MTELRPFRNDDVQGVVAVWNAQPPLRGRLQALTASLFEQHILAKPFFDPAGLIVAHGDSQIDGWIHVAFVPSVRPFEFERQTGVVCQLLVRPDADADLTRQLLVAGEARLREQGAESLRSGGVGDRAPFYLGLYGGCRLPGVLAEDTRWRETLQAHGYSERSQITIWHRELAGFRSPVDRASMALKRKHSVQFEHEVVDSGAARDWCETCAFAWIDRTRLQILATPTSPTPVGALDFWDMEPLASSWGFRARGFAHAKFENEAMRGEFLPCFLGEALRQFSTEGVALAEIQCGAEDEVLTAACGKLGFVKRDYGTVFEKT